MFASSSKAIFNVVRRRSVAVVRAAERRAAASSSASSAALRDASPRAQQHRTNRQGAPWAFREEDRPTQLHRGDPVVKYNITLQSLSHKELPRDALALCTEMKQKGIRPDRSTYAWLISALASQTNLFRECWAAYLDMKAMGIEPDVYIFNQLLRSVRVLGSEESIKIIDEMRRHGIKPDNYTHDLLVQRYTQGDNVELALRRLTDMEDAGHAPSLETAQNLVSKIAETGLPRLALDLADAFEQESVRRLDSATWLHLLTSCAQYSYADGLTRCWNHVIKDLTVAPTEGLCVDVLQAAAALGLPILASEVLQQLEKLKVPLQDFHVVPLIDAFAINGNIKEAFRVLELLHSTGTVPTVDTARSILQAIQRDTDTVDNAFTFLQELKEEGNKVDETAVNIIIQAAVFLGDLQRAVGTYKAMSTLDVKPDVTTFNLLLGACASVGHRDLGERLFSEMQEALLKPNLETYKQIIALHLTKSDYEEAFFYLEEMKAVGIKPPYAVYDAIVRKCVSVGDSRYKLAEDEVKQMDYELTPELVAFIDSGGNIDTSNSRRSRTN